MISLEAIRDDVAFFEEEFRSLTKYIDKAFLQREKLVKKIYFGSRIKYKTATKPGDAGDFVEAVIVGRVRIPKKHKEELAAIAAEVHALHERRNNVSYRLRTLRALSTAYYNDPLTKPT